MKISLERSLSCQKGWANFVTSLICQLERMYDVKIVGKKDKSDIHLSVISGFKPHCKNVLRIDGVYYDEVRRKRNKSIYNSIQTADAVVFQSNWCRTLVTRMLNIIPKKDIVIYNGVDQSSITKSKSKSMPMMNGFKKWWVCCSHWRVNKRPRAIADAFTVACDHRSDVGMIFLGHMDESFKKKHANILYAGEVNRSDLFSYLKGGNWMCHICHIDACPNSVIEGLSCGLPVLCNNIGGTPEIVAKDGIIVPLDKEFKFKFIKESNQISSVDIDLLSSNMVKMMNLPWSVSRPDLDISVAAHKYYNLFLELLHQ